MGKPPKVWLKYLPNIFGVFQLFAILACMKLKESIWNPKELGSITPNCLLTLRVSIVVVIIGFSVFLHAQSFKIEGYADQSTLRVERTYTGEIEVYDGTTKVQSIEKNYLGGYDLFSYSRGYREKIKSVEKGVGDEYIVYGFNSFGRYKINAIKGLDSYMQALYGAGNNQNPNSPVQVYDVKGGYITDLGKTVLPADVKPLDYSALDSYMDTRTKLMEKDLERVKQIAAYLESGKATESEKKVLIDELKRIKKFWDEH